MSAAVQGLQFYEASGRAHRRSGREACSVGGCDQGRYCRGLCTMHYTRMRKTGSVGEPTRQRGVFGEGHVNEYGYRDAHSPNHPLASRRAQNKIEVHRVVLYDAIGPGPHPCHWCASSLQWTGAPRKRICVDHLDFNRLNNEITNLVVSCLDCNTKRQEARA